jgi:uncharacterized Zn finger protein (UPF0148 family)
MIHTKPAEFPGTLWGWFCPLCGGPYQFRPQPVDGVVTTHCPYCGQKETCAWERDVPSDSTAKDSPAEAPKETEATGAAGLPAVRPVGGDAAVEAGIASLDSGVPPVRVGGFRPVEG